MRSLQGAYAECFCADSARVSIGAALDSILIHSKAFKLALGFLNLRVTQHKKRAAFWGLRVRPSQENTAFFPKVKFWEYKVLLKAHCQNKSHKWDFPKT